MRKWIAVLLLAMAVVLVGASGGRRASTHRAAHTTKHRAKAKARQPGTRIECIGCPRDSHGRIKRSGKAKTAFMRRHPCPATGRSKGPCPGYVIDHIVPLKRGGADAPENMQWQTKAQAKVKDRTE